MLLEGVDEQLKCFVDALKNKVNSQPWCVIDFKKKRCICEIICKQCKTSYIL